jgi:glycosyltransferase involved in cell wall biosynthesis
MKVAWVLPGGVDRSGERRVIPAVLWLLERMARRAEVHVFAVRQEERSCRYPLRGATVHAVGAPARRPRVLAAIRSVHRADPFDVVYATGGIGAHGIAALAGRLLRIPVVIHLTGGEVAQVPEASYGGRLTWRGRLWNRFALGRAQQLIALSTPILDLVQALGYPAVRIPFGVDLDKWPPLAPRPRDPGRAIRLLHVGSLNRVKDQVTLLESMSVLRASGVAFRLDVIGQDTLEGASSRVARHLNLQSHVHFLGFRSNDQVRAHMQRADLLLVSSRHEAGPVVALEAAVCGVPTVGTDVGFLQEWAPDAAATVPVGDARGMAEAVMELLADDARRVRLATAAQARARHEDADDVARRILTVLHGAADLREGVG